LSALSQPLIKEAAEAKAAAKKAEAALREADVEVMEQRRLASDLKAQLDRLKIDADYLKAR
jgi:hypothetical protein